MRHLAFCSLLLVELCVPGAGLTRQASAAERVSPPVNREATAQIGDELLHQGDFYQRAAIHLSESLTFGKDGEYSLAPGYYVRTGESVGWESYVPADGPDAGRVHKAKGAITLQGSFLYSNDGKTIGVITNFYQAVNATAIGITRTTRPSVSQDAIQRSLVYGGKTGTKIKLAYREIFKNITRPSRSVFKEYDLADSSVVEVRGARIEIFEATNDRIRYRVTRAFDSEAN